MAMATLAQIQTREDTFWPKMAIGISAFILFGFAQFAARGMVDYAAVPAYVHVHAVVMVSWLGFMVVQPMLVQRGNVALHRKLGWIGAAWAVLVMAVCSYVGVKIVQIGQQPFFFTPPYFLALTQVGVIAFGGLVVAAIVRRRETDWHRRLLLGTLVILMEPALGRVLPMPLIMPWGEWLALAIQLGVLAIVIRHDRKTLGAIHPATTSVVLVVTLAHVVVETLAISPFWIGWTKQVMGA
jgi:hypothetical protein